MCRGEVGGIIFMPPDRNFGGIFSIISLLEKVMMESYEVGGGREGRHTVVA